MYAVKANEPPSVYQDAYAKGWQLVYDDSIVFTQSGGWINMTLSSPFYLPRAIIYIYKMKTEMV